MQSGVDAGTRHVEFAVRREQERLWRLWRLRPGSPELNLSFAFALRGHLDPYALKRAVLAVSTRHESLRARYRDTSVGVQQIVVADPLVDFESIDMSAPLGSIGPQRSLVEAFAAIPFDLEDGPVLRCRLVKTAPDAYVLAFVVHHIAADGWSLRIMCNDLSTYYSMLPCESASNSASVGQSAPGFASFATAERAREATLLTRHTPYWRRQLAGLRCERSLTDLSHAASIDFADSTPKVQLLSPTLVAQITAFARQCEASPFAVWYAAIHILASDLFGSDDLGIGSVIDGRSMESMQVVGNFLNRTILRMDSQDDPLFWQLVKRANRTVSEAVLHQAMPYNAIVGLVCKQEESSTLLTPRVTLVHGRTEPLSLRLRAIRSYPFRYSYRGSRTELGIHVSGTGSRWRLMVAYSSDAYSSRQASVICKSIPRLMMEILDQPNVRISAIRKAVTSSRRQLA